MNQTVIIYGPQGCGKSRAAERIRQHFGLERILDNVDSFDLNHVKWMPAGVLYLVSCEINPAPHITRCMSFADVAQQINAAIPLTDWQSGPPPAAGEYVASTRRNDSLCSWWNGKFWSVSYGKEVPQAEKNRRAGLQSHSPWEKEWRGLAEEPIRIPEVA